MKAIDDAAKERVDAAHLLGREVLWDGESSEIGDGRLVATKLGLELPRGGRERRRAGRLGMERPFRIVEQRAPIELVGDAKRVDQGRDIGLGQSVTFDAREDLILLIGLQSGEGERERGADGAVGDEILELLRATRADREPVVGPGRLPAEHPGCSSDGKAVVLDEGRQHLGLVQRSHGARRRVGGEQHALVLHARCGALDEDRHHRAALLDPALQALDAIEDLESIGALERGDTERELGERRNGNRERAAPKPSVGGRQPIDRHVADLAGGCSLSAGVRISGETPPNARSALGHGTSWRDATENVSGGEAASSVRDVVVRRGQRSRPVLDDPQPRLPPPQVVLDADVESSAEKLGGIDRHSGAKLQTGGAEQLYEAPPGEREDVVGCALDHEVVGEPSVGGGDALEGVNDMDHAVAAGAGPHPGPRDGARVEAGGQEADVEIVGVEAEVGHGGDAGTRDLSAFSMGVPT